MTPLFISVLLAATSLECRAQKDNVLQPEGDETAAEGEAVTLGCQYNSTSFNHYLFWYKQDGNNSPKFILSRFTVGTGKTEDQERFSSTLNSALRSVPLRIQKLQLSDSAVYYCALNGAGTKTIFGSGTRLTVEPKEVYKPSFYELSDGETTACLATGFSQLWAANNTHNDIFEKTSAVRIGDDSLFNEVALLSKDDKDKCQRAEAASELCEDTLEPDAKVNLMSLTILGLRLLFLKTIVFNVLLTLRLWISP